ncbi:breast cancer type 2 susceptibility protein-like [Ctenocephalides felis]|uniref:breast cancer type 2 susceptibility protein-like n=1 Tax=Ctenocephalides felis TaxID=7515 RepID=UPI000E6E2445|nr:breast cancer type 2 susceptibility protein-like [Ctenocephalides felis]
MNNNITPTKNDYYNVPSSPVFNQTKSVEDSASNKIQSEISTHEKNATNISNEISCDKLEQTHDNKQKKYMLYSEKSKKNNSRDKISIKKNILSYAKCLESLNKTERQSRMKAKQLLSQGLQTFSAIENIEQTSQSKELTLSSSLTDSELITANDLLQDFETKAIDFSQWTGNTEFMHTSPKSCIFQEQTNNEKNNISKKNCAELNLGILENEADLADFNGFELQEKLSDFALKKHIFTLLPYTKTRNCFSENSGIKNKSTLLINPSKNEQINQLEPDECIDKFTGLDKIENDTANLLSLKIFNNICLKRKISKESDQITNSASLENHKSSEHGNITESDADNISVNSNKLFEFKESLADGSDIGLGINNSGFVGFQSASGKHIKISKKALTKSKKLFEDNDSSDNIIPISSEQVCLSNEQSSGYLQSANDKNISDPEDFSKNSSNEGKKKYIPENNEIPANSNEFRIQSVNMMAKFGKTIPISQNALEKSRKLFEDDEISAKDENSTKDRDKICPFVGFHTGSGKQIPISQNALTKCRKLFEDNEVADKEYENCTKEANRDKISSFVGFQSGSGKQIPISQNALAKSRKLFEDSEISDKEYENFTKEANGDKLLVLFQSDSGQKIQISQNALEKSRKLFPDNDISDKGENYTKEVNKDKISHFVGFQSGSGKQIPISQSALEKSKTLFQDNEISDEEYANCTKEVDRDKICTFIGFQSGSGKTIPISQNALKKSRMHLQDKEFSDKDKNCTKGEDRAKNCPFIGFQSASGKKIQISQNALEKSRKLFLDDELSDEGENCFQSSDEANWNKISPYVGFQSGSGKKIPISQNALEKSRKLFQDNEISDNEYENCTKGPNRDNNCPFIGFQSGSGKKIQISQNALEKSRKLFQDDDLLDKCENYTKEVNKDKIVTFVGFQSGSGKQIPISQSALEKSERLFQDNEISDKEYETCTKEVDGVKISTFMGFQSGSGKQISISQSALEKSRKLFQDDEFSDKGESCTKEVDRRKISTFMGFQSGSGKKIQISQNALEKSRKLFQDNELSDKCENYTKEINMDKIYPFVGFQSGSGKQIPISQSALEKSKRLLQDNEIQIKNMKIVLKNGKTIPISQSALEKSKKLFEDNEILDKDLENSTKEVDRGKNSSIKGFQSGSGKQIPISQSALEKSRIFQDDEFSDKGESCTKEVDREKISSFKGFQSGSGKQIPISENALEKSRKLFQDDEISDEGENYTKELNRDKIGTFVGFQSGNDDSQKYLEKTSILLDGYEISAKDSKSYPEDADVNLNLGLKTNRKLFETDISTSKKYYFIRKNKARDITDKEHIESKVIWKFNNISSSSNNEFHDGKIQQDTDLYYKQPLSPILMKKPISVNKAPKSDDNVSISQEIKESTSALMADEMSFIDDSIFKGSIVTSPSSFLNDVSNTLQPVLINADATQNELQIQQCTTFNKNLGARDLFKKKPEDKTKERNLNNQINKSTEALQSKFKIPLKPGLNKVVDNSLKRRAVDMDLDYSVPFAKKNKEVEFENNSIDIEMILFNTQIISKIDERIVSEDVCTMRNMSYEKQKMRIKHIKRRKIDCKPLRGSSLTNKIGSTDRVSCYDRDTLLYKFHLKKNIIDVSIQNIDNFIFSAWDYYSNATCKTNTSGIECGDGAILILDENSNITQERIVTSFLTSPGVDSNIINDTWVKNHIKWIILKLASMERSFPNLFANKACTPHNLMLQLKYRYDREVDEAEKSCLKKILQTDDTPSKPMVLYCADIYKLDSKLNDTINDKQVFYELELSDGWYSVRTKIDLLMSKMISDGKFQIGDKIYTVGSVLLNCLQGCDPLEVPEDVRLQIFSNSSTRARWDMRLGFTGLPPMLPCLGTIHYLGGVIHSTEFVIVRRYPMMYLVKHNGKTTMHSEKLELKLAQEYERKKSEEMEKIYSQVRKSYEQELLEQARNKFVVNETDINKIRCAEELCELMRLSHDPSALQNELTDSQKNLMLEHYDKKRNDITNEIFNRVQDITNKENTSKRSSSQLLKIRVVPLCKNSIPTHNKSVIISIWRPNALTCDVLNENQFIRAHNCTAESIRNGDLQISAGRQASFKIISNKRRIGFKTYPFRTFTSITDMYKNNFNPVFNEIDTVGVVFYISTFRNASSFQSVFIADLNKKIIEISFWGGIQHHGYEKLIAVKTILACSNLQWRNKNSGRQILYLYVTDLTTFSANPQQLHLQKVFNSFELSLKNTMEQFVNECKQSLWASKMSPNTSTNFTPERKYSPSINMEVESKRTPPVQKRLDMLSTLPEPPKLSPVSFKTPTKRFTKPFKPPKPILDKMNNNTNIESGSPPLSLE